jgi:hypothetical protein
MYHGEHRYKFMHLSGDRSHNSKSESDGVSVLNANHESSSGSISIVGKARLAPMLVDTTIVAIENAVRSLTYSDRTLSILLYKPVPFPVSYNIQDSFSK